jgi:hypothetical protein
MSLGLFIDLVRPAALWPWSHLSLLTEISKKVKLSHYRAGEALGVPGGWGSRISRQSAHEGGKVVSPTHRPSLPPGRISGTISVGRWVDPRAKMRSEGLSHWKIPVTPSGIEPATFQFVAQCLNQLRHRVPLNRNERQGYLLGCKGGRCTGLTTLPLSCAECLEILGALRACPVL